MSSGAGPNPPLCSVYRVAPTIPGTWHTSPRWVPSYHSLYSSSRSGCDGPDDTSRMALGMRSPHGLARRTAAECCPPASAPAMSGRNRACSRSIRARRCGAAPSVDRRDRATVGAPGRDPRVASRAPARLGAHGGGPVVAVLVCREHASRRAPTHHHGAPRTMTPDRRSHRDPLALVRDAPSREIDVCHAAKRRAPSPRPVGSSGSRSSRVESITAHEISES